MNDTLTYKNISFGPRSIREISHRKNSKTDVSSFRPSLERIIHSDEGLKLEMPDVSSFSRTQSTRFLSKLNPLSSEIS